MRKNYRSAILAMVLAGALLTGGCGKSVTVSEELENISGRGTTAEAEQTTAEEKLEGLGLPKGLVEDVFESDNKEKKMHVSYRVEDPELTQNNLPIYEMDRVEMNDEYLTKIVKQIFDDGSWKVMKPAPYCTKEELEEQLNYLTEEVQENEKSRMGVAEVYATLALRGVLVELQEGAQHSTAQKTVIELAEMPDGVLPLIYSDENEKWKDPMALVAGTINGEHFLLRYEKMGCDEEIVIFKTYTEQELFRVGRVAEGMIGADGSSNGANAIPNAVMGLLDDTTNRSSISKCMSAAEEVKRRLGREDLVNCEIYEDIIRSVAMTGQSDGQVNGYKIEYYTGNELLAGTTFENYHTVRIDMNKTLVPYLGIDAYGTSDKFGIKEDDLAVMESLIVDTRDDRLFEVTIRFKYDNYREKEMANLLPFSKIQEALEAISIKMLNYAEIEKNDLPFFGEQVELRYLPVEKNGVSELVPAWVFYLDSGDSEFNVGWIAIDATNADVIEFVL